MFEHSLNEGKDDPNSYEDVENGEDLPEIRLWGEVAIPDGG